MIRSSGKFRFKDIDLEVFEYNGDHWFMLNECAKPLGYAQTSGLHTIYNRHEQELAPYSSTLKMRVQVGKHMQLRYVRIINKDCIIMLCFFINTDVAHEFRKWAIKVLRDVLETGQHIEPGLLPEHETEIDSHTALVPRHQSVAIQSQRHTFNTPEILETQQPPPGMMLVDITHNNQFRYPQALWISAIDWAEKRYGKRLPKNFNGGGGSWERYVRNQWRKDHNGEWPPKRYPPVRETRQVHYEYVYPRGPELDEYLLPLLKDYLKMNYPNQKCLKLK